MSQTEAPVIHDGQADAMPCACPACISPFVTQRPRLRIVPSTRRDGDRDHLREARAC